jgi:hypothetical protein
MKRPLVLFATLAAVLAMPLVGAAHNAGHLFLPDGTCLEVGSFKDAPFVGKDRTRLDLAPETPYPPFDEIGVSWVGHLQVSVILPGPCPALSTNTGTSTSSNNATVKPDTRTRPDAAGKTNRGSK